MVSDEEEKEFAQESVDLSADGVAVPNDNPLLTQPTGIRPAADSIATIEPSPHISALPATPPNGGLANDTEPGIDALFFDSATPLQLTRSE